MVGLGFLQTLLYSKTGLGPIQMSRAFKKIYLYHKTSRCSDPYESQCLSTESEKYQGSYSVRSTPRFKSYSTYLKDLLFAWWKELEAEKQEAVLSPTSNLTLDKKALNLSSLPSSHRGKQEN